jgi:hypothetical protein
MTWMLAAMLSAQMGGAGMVTVAHDLMSSIESPQQVVVQDDTAWARIWRAHAGETLPPHVDFSTHTVLAVFLGTRPTGGFDVEITGVRQDGAVTVVEWVERRPAPGQLAAMVLTSPAHVVAVPRITGDVRFEKAGDGATGR